MKSSPTVQWAMMYKICSVKYTELGKNYLKLVVPVHDIKEDERVEVQLHPFLAVSLDGGEWSALCLSCSSSSLTYKIKSPITEQLPRVNK